MIEEFFKPAIQKTIQFIEANNLWAVYIVLLIIFLLSFLIGYLISWIINKRKLKSEIRKLDIETKNKQLEFIEKIQVYRSKFIQNSEIIAVSAYECIIALENKDINKFNTTYEEFNNFFFNTVLVSFFHYLEVVEIYFKDDKRKRLFVIDDEIFRLFKTIRLFLNTVNNSTILKLLQRNRVNVSKETINHAIRYVKSNTNFFDLKRRKKLKEYLIDFKIN